MSERQSDRLRQPETLDKLQLALVDLLPIRHDEQMAAVPLGGQMVNQPYEQVVLFIDPTETTSAAIRSTALTVETTTIRTSPRFEMTSTTVRSRSQSCR